MKISSVLTLSSLLWAGPILASRCKPSPASSSSVSPVSATSSSPALPSSSSDSTTTNPGQVCTSTNLFVDADISLADLSDWPHDINTGSPSYFRSVNCSTYAACIEVDLIVAGGAQDIDFYQSVTVSSGATYAGHFYYRMPLFTGSGKSMATLTCTLNGVTKYSKTLCAGEELVNWKEVDFSLTADSTDAVLKCKVTTSGVGAQFQFADFYLAENC